MVSFQGLNESVTTFLGTATVGVPVKVSASATVANCADGNVFCGVACGGRDGCVAVQVSGYVKLPYSGTAPTVGYVKLVADDSGGVKTSSSGREYLVVELDTTAKTVGFIL